MALTRLTQDPCGLIFPIKDSCGPTNLPTITYPSVQVHMVNLSLATWFKVLLSLMNLEWDISVVDISHLGLPLSHKLYHNSI